MQFKIYFNDVNGVCNYATSSNVYLINTIIKHGGFHMNLLSEVVLTPVKSGSWIPYHQVTLIRNMED
jgi:hypothetical protein